MIIVRSFPLHSDQNTIVLLAASYTQLGKEWKKPVRNPDRKSRAEAGRDDRFAWVQTYLWIPLIDEVPGSLIDDEGFPGDSDGGCPGDTCHSR